MYISFEITKRDVPVYGSEKSNGVKINRIKSSIIRKERNCGNTQKNLGNWWGRICR